MQMHICNMKFIRLLLSLAIILIVTPGFAKIWTVDNTFTSKANFKDLNSATTAASSGDTIIVMPSSTPYDNTNVTKKLFIYSDGHHSKRLRYDRAPFIANNINISTGGNGTVIKGLRFLNLVLQADSCLIEYNFLFGGILHYNGNHNIIRGNVFFRDWGGASWLLGSTANHNLFAHNYVYSYAANGDGRTIVDGGNSTNLFRNNLCVDNFSSSTANMRVCFRNSQITIANNIFWTNAAITTPYDTTSPFAVFRNNLTYASRNTLRALPGSGNINDTMPEFETSFSSTSTPNFSTTNNFRLKSGSQGKNAGTDSTDVGLFGAGYTFHIDGRVPEVAIFEAFEIVNPVVKKGQVVKVKLTARKQEGI